MAEYGKNNQPDAINGEAMRWSEDEAYGFEDADYSVETDDYEPRDPSEDSWDTEFEINEENESAAGFF